MFLSIVVSETKEQCNHFCVSKAGTICPTTFSVWTLHVARCRQMVYLLSSAETELSYSCMVILLDRCCSQWTILRKFHRRVDCSTQARAVSCRHTDKFQLFTFRDKQILLFSATMEPENWSICLQNTHLGTSWNNLIYFKIKQHFSRDSLMLAYRHPFTSCSLLLRFYKYNFSSIPYLPLKYFLLHVPPILKHVHEILVLHNII